MALLKGTLPLTHAAARRAGFIWQKDTNGRVTVSKWAKRHARPVLAKRAFPFSNPTVPAGRYARTLLTNYSHGYKDFLTPAQQLAWDALAAANIVMTASGALKTLTGQQLYDWYSALNYFWSGAYCLQVSLSDQVIFTDPPAVWNPPLTPLVTGFDAPDPFAFGVYLTTTPNLAWDNAHVLISTQNPRTRSRQRKHFVRCNWNISGVDPPSGTYQLGIYLTPTFSKPSQLRNPTIRIRTISDYPNLVPSDFTEVVVPF